MCNDWQFTMKSMILIHGVWWQNNTPMHIHNKASKNGEVAMQAFFNCEKQMWKKIEFVFTSNEIGVFIPKQTHLHVQEWWHMCRCGVHESQTVYQDYSCGYFHKCPQWSCWSNIHNVQYQHLIDGNCEVAHMTATETVDLRNSENHWCAVFVFYLEPSRNYVTFV